MIELEIKGFNKLQMAMSKYPAISEKHINKGIRNSLIRIQDQAKREAPFGGTGNLRGRWDLNVGRFEGKLGSGAKNKGFYYGPAVEYGTRPHYVSPKTLSGWAKRKGLNPYAVSKSIQRKGTKANPFFQRSIDKQEKNVQKEFNKALDNILKEI